MGERNEKRSCYHIVVMMQTQLLFLILVTEVLNVHYLTNHPKPCLWMLYFINEAILKCVFFIMQVVLEKTI